MIRRVLNRVLPARRQERRPRLLTAELLAVLARERPDASFIEIGANDGKQHDHVDPFLAETRWTGVMVEPVDYIFERLRANHGSNPRLKLERAVISDSDGTVDFFCLRPPQPHERAKLPSWYDGIGSLERDVVFGHRHDIPDIDERLMTRELPSLSFESLCEKHGIQRLDLLVIDTEGHDCELLEGVDLGRYQPLLVIYEHFHLSANEQAGCRARLHECGYLTAEEGFDTVCLQEKAPASMQLAWQRTPPVVAGVFAYDEVGR